jgi:hypothetical protein
MSGVLSSVAKALAAAPGLSALTVSILGVAFGFCLTVLAVIHAYLVRALPYSDLRHS